MISFSLVIAGWSARYRRNDCRYWISESFRVVTVTCWPNVIWASGSKVSIVRSRDSGNISPLIILPFRVFILIYVFIYYVYD